MLDKVISKIAIAPEIVRTQRLLTVCIHPKDKTLCSDICTHLKNGRRGPFELAGCELFLVDLEFQREVWEYTGGKKRGTVKKQTKYMGQIRCEECLTTMGK